MISVDIHTDYYSAGSGFKSLTAHKQAGQTPRVLTCFAFGTPLGFFTLRVVSGTFVRVRRCVVVRVLEHPIQDVERLPIGDPPAQVAILGHADLGVPEPAF
jgi:hypothetical protein